MVSLKQYLFPGNFHKNSMDVTRPWTPLGQVLISEIFTVDWETKKFHWLDLSHVPILRAGTELASPKTTWSHNREKVVLH